MNKVMEDVATALDALSVHVLNSWGENRTLKEIYGWNHSALTRQNLATFASDLASRIRTANIEDVPEEIELQLSKVPAALQSMHADTVPYMFNGNGVNAVPAYLFTLESISKQVEPLLYWRSISDQKQMPTSVYRRLRALTARLDELEPDFDSLSSQINAIREANEAAESLPSDLQSLKRARNDVVKIGSEASEYLGTIKKNETDSNDALGRLKVKELEVEEIVSKCESAYKTTTSQGLAASFEARAQSLSISMWSWVVGLLAALIFVAILGSKRVELLTKVLEESQPEWGIIIIHIVLSMISVGAPLWFAWLATKQIGQRFRLSEDYAFKSSVAKAYEGYRREAARIDPALEARLFQSALTRLEEAPLRLVEEQTHGSPWHEAIQDSEIKQILKRKLKTKASDQNVSQQD